MQLDSLPGIVIRALTHRYAGADSDALRGIDLDIPAGSIFGLLGPNGAGKTTLVGLLSGVLRPQMGEVTIGGESLATRAKAIKAFSALVPQDYAFYAALSGRENLQFFAGVYGLTRAQRHARIEHCAKLCQLTDILEQRAEHYSGGQKRRLNLAIGLLHQPRVLYLDEPTVGIDALSRQHILAAIRTLNRDGATIVYTSHYMEEVEALCDEVAVIDHGRVVVRDRLDNLLQKNAGQRLQIRVRAPLSSALAAELAAFAATHADDCNWTLQVPEGELSRVLALLERHGAQVERMHYGVSRLEEIYLGLLAAGHT